jgi:hypothetical protein
MGAGAVTPEEVDDLVELWHEGAGGDLPLHEFLGMSWDEYKTFVQEGVIPVRDVNG